MTSIATTRRATTLVVTSSADSGPGSLREAILRANALPHVASIVFKLPRDQLTIRPLSPLPYITRTVSIDARTQPGWKGNPIVELDGSLAGTITNLAAVDGLLMIERASDSLVAGLVFNRYSGNGVSAGAKTSPDDAIALVSAAGRGRVRLEFPFPGQESVYDVMELRR